MARRGSPLAEDHPVVQVGARTVDLANRRVTGVDGSDIRLTPTEWHLLEVFVRNPGKLLSQSHLLAEVWGPGYENAHGNLRLYMGQLRRKLEDDPSHPKHLVNEPGLGYRFEP
jgi:two-component system KDP operon response regulator KdpE